MGVTGGIGSGKSTVCSMFEQRGVHVLYADELAQRIASTTPAVRRAVEKLLGPEAYTVNGVLNRSYVASQVFGNRRLLQSLNAIVHPRVERAIVSEFHRLAREGVSLVIVEAALIYEAGLDRMLDAVIVVDARESLRIERTLARGAMTRKDIERRMQSQWSVDRKLQRADFIIQNNGSLADLERRVQFLHSLLLMLSKGKRS